ncbi:MAG: hypothetical protein EBR82_08320 [Caulobacteraceae bacterium]|nr:hypothetical protein [Caulobacteraceae bacterium]
MSTIALAAALLMQVQVFAPSTQQPQPRPAPAATQATAPGETPAEPEVTQVCRMVPVTGTRFPRRVCRSDRQNRADSEESQDMLRNYQGLGNLDASSNAPKGQGAPGPL